MAATTAASRTDRAQVAQQPANVGRGGDRSERLQALGRRRLAPSDPGRLVWA